MKYNFDEVIERRGTDSVKYDAVYRNVGDGATCFRCGWPIWISVLLLL